VRSHWTVRSTVIALDSELISQPFMMAVLLGQVDGAALLEQPAGAVLENSQALPPASMRASSSFSSRQDCICRGRSIM